MGTGVRCENLYCTKNIYGLCLQLLEEASAAAAVCPLGWLCETLGECLCEGTKAKVRPLSLFGFVCLTESPSLSSFRLVLFLRICCYSCRASCCQKIFLAFSKVNSGSSCRCFDNTLLLTPTTVRPQIKSSFTSLYKHSCPPNC